MAQTLTSHPHAAAAAATPPPTAETSPPAAASTVAETVSGTFDPRAARVRQLILENKSAKEIIGEVWGTSGGDSYRKASAEYQTIVRRLVRR